MRSGLLLYPGTAMLGTGTGRGFPLTPHMDVKETDKEIVVETELPGIDEKDVSLALQDGVTIRGEKKHEQLRTVRCKIMMPRSVGT
jgi:HSP20 family protein